MAPPTELGREDVPAWDEETLALFRAATTDIDTGRDWLTVDASGLGPNKVWKVHARGEALISEIAPGERDGDAACTVVRTPETTAGASCAQALSPASSALRSPPAVATAPIVCGPLGQLEATHTVSVRVERADPLDGARYRLWAVRAGGGADRAPWQELARTFLGSGTTEPLDRVVLAQRLGLTRDIASRCRHDLYVSTPELRDSEERIADVDGFRALLEEKGWRTGERPSSWLPPSCRFAGDGSKIRGVVRTVSQAGVQACTR